MLIRLHAHFCIPGVMHFAIRILGFLPEGGVLCFDRGDEIRRVSFHLEARMHGRQQDQVYPCLAEFGCLPVHGPVSSQEDDGVERDNPDGDHRPAASLHVFVAKRDQHGEAPSEARSGGVREWFS